MELDYVLQNTSSYQEYTGYTEQVDTPNPVADAIMPTLIESSLLGIVIFYLVNSIIKPILIDDRNRWFEVIEKLAGSIDRLADKFEDLENRIDRLEDRFKD